MKIKSQNKHMIDMLFILSLFLVFTVSGVLLIIFGVNVYQNTVDNMDKNYTSRTSIAFFTEKLRQGDISGSISTTSQDGVEVLKFTQIIEGNEYATSLYEYEGKLLELFSRSDIELPLDAGQEIMDISNLHFTWEEANLLKITFTDLDGNDIELYYNIHSGGN